ncbi:hypothetical protein SASPL_141826 [Salvia splendens]|uniref:Mitochondrial import inner membrane translocase subunit TIM23 n=2 Tax=Salvia splendens TaxID=180675 RepID=A0A8X8Z8Y1_SALSN|nr:hypothetical protein SASPL_141826 [Salvia splendens]
MAYTPQSPNRSHSDDETTSNRRLYNPYKDLNLPSQTLYHLPTQPEFLFQEESIAQRRSWGENITYYTGIGYLAGATGGAAQGLATAVKAIEPTDTTKLKINRILNGSGHRGRQIGNRCGVIGLMYAGLESGMVAWRDTDDVINSVVAGLATGALYKAASGPRAAALAGALGGVVVGAAVAGKPYLKRYIPLFLNNAQETLATAILNSIHFLVMLSTLFCIFYSMLLQWMLCLCTIDVAFHGIVCRDALYPFNNVVILLQEMMLIEITTHNTEVVARATAPSVVRMVEW